MCASNLQFIQPIILTMGGENLYIKPISFYLSGAVIPSDIYSFF